MNPEFKPKENSILKENDGKGYYKLFSYFVITLLKEFQEYSKKESINILEYGSGFQAIPIYASTEDLQEIGQQFANIIRVLSDVIMILFCYIKIYTQLWHIK